MKYRVDYKVVDHISGHSLKKGVICCCLFDDTPFDKMVYIEPFLVDENGNISNGEEIDFENFINNLDLKKGFIIEKTEKAKDENVFDIFDENGNIIKENLVHRRAVPFVDLSTDIFNFKSEPSEFAKFIELIQINFPDRSSLFDYKDKDDFENHDIYLVKKGGRRECDQNMAGHRGVYDGLYQYDIFLLSVDKGTIFDEWLETTKKLSKYWNGVLGKLAWKNCWSSISQEDYEGTLIIKKIN